MKEIKPKPNRKIIKAVIYSLTLGVLTGTFFAVMAGFFIPVIFTDWAGSFVCNGKMVFMSLQRSYYCYTSTATSYDLGNKVFWTFFKMFLLPCLGICSFLWFLFYAFIESITREKT